MKTPRDPAPGWKSDPRNKRRLRYWDGQGWTERSAPTRRETADKFVAFEEGGAEKPPAVSIQHRTPPPPRTPKPPDPVPAPTNPGVLATYAGFLAVIVGSFGPWTQDIIKELGYVPSPYVASAIAVIAIASLTIYLFGKGERWRDFVGGLAGVTLANVGVAIWEITHFSDDYPRVAVDPTIGWGLWLTAAGCLIALAGMAYVYYGPRSAKTGSEPSA